jgi:large-conductance mechanosensitive channel
MFKKFYNLNFGLQALVLCVSLILLNPMITFTLSLANNPSTFMFYTGVILTLLLFAVQTGVIFIAISAVIKYIKKDKNKNTDNEQSN